MFTGAEKRLYEELKQRKLSQIPLVTSNRLPDFTERFQGILRGRLEALQSEPDPLVKLFVSSTFTDTTAERNYLMARVYPELREFCRGFGLDFRVIDLRWGITDESTDDHATNSICQREIARCRSKSIGPCFVYFSTQKYGWRPLPPTVQQTELDVMMTAMDFNLIDTSTIFFQNSQVEKSGEALLRAWYVLDQNMVLAHYRLQPMSSVIPQMDRHSPRYDSRLGWQIWNDVQQQLEKLLRDAAEKCKDALLKIDAYEKWIVSVTAQEVRTAINTCRERAIIMQRDIGGLEDGSAHFAKPWNYINMLPDGANQKIDTASLELLHTLRQEARNAIPLANDYQPQLKQNTDLSKFSDAPYYILEFCTDLYVQLTRAIEQAVREQPPPNALHHEIVKHSEICQLRAEAFTSREYLIDAIKQSVRQSNGQVVVVHGESGSGKTSVLAVCAAHTRELFGDNTVVISRFCGTSPDSSSGRSLLLSLCQQLGLVYGVHTEAETYKELVEEFRSLLFLAPPDQHLAIYIDSLDQLNNDDQARSDLLWLPKDTLPSHVHLVVSTIPDEQYEAFPELKRRALPDSNFVPVPQLATSETGDILDSWLRHDSRALTVPQKAAVLNAAGPAPTALKLKVLYDVTLTWKSTDEAHMHNLHNDVPTIIAAVLQRLEHYHGHTFVTHCFGYLAASKSGLTEQELLDVLSMDEEVLNEVLHYHDPPQRRLPPLVFHLLMYKLDGNLVERGADGLSVLAWYHRQWWQAADKRYKGPDALLVRSQMLATYFSGQAATDLKTCDRSISPQPLYFTVAKPGGDIERILNLRKLTELPNALTGSRQYTQLADTCLCNLEFIKAKSVADKVLDLLSDYREALDSIRTEGAHHAELLEKLLAFSTFANSQAPTLNRTPHLALQQAHNEPDSSLVRLLAQQHIASSNVPMLTWLNKPQTLAQCMYTLEGHTDVVSKVKFFPDRSNLCVSGSSDRSIRVWDLHTGRQLFGIRLHEKQITSLTLSACGRYIASADESNVVMLFDASTGARIAYNHTVQGQYGAGVYILQFTNDGSQLIAASGTCLWPGLPVGCVTVFDAKTLTIVGIPLSYSLDRTVLGISSDGKTCLVQHGGDNWHTFFDLGTDKYELWDIEVREGEEWNPWQDPVVRYEVENCGSDWEGYERKRAQGDQCAVDYDLGHVDDSKKLYGKTEAGRRIRTFFLLTDGQSKIPFGYSFATDKILRTWPLNKGLKVVMEGNECVVVDMSVTGATTEALWPFGVESGSHTRTPDGKVMVCSSFRDMLDIGKNWKPGNVAYLFDMDPLTAPTPNKYFARLGGHSSAIGARAFSPDGTLLVTGSRDGTLKVWPVHSNRTIIGVDGGAVLDGFKRELACVSADGRTVVSKRRDVVEVRTGEGCLTRSTHQGHLGGIYCLALTTDGSLTASAGGDCVVAIWNIAKGWQKEACSIALDNLEGSSVLLHLTFSPLCTSTSGVIAGCGSNRQITLWKFDVESGKMEVSATLAGHVGWVKTIAYSPDGSMLASGAFDATVRLWRMPEADGYRDNQSYQLRYNDSSSAVFSLAWLPVGLQLKPRATRLLVGYEDGALVMFDVQDTKAGTSKIEWIVPGCFTNEVEQCQIARGLGTGIVLASSSEERLVRSFELSTGAPLANYRIATLVPVSSLALDKVSNGHMVVFTSDGQTMRMDLLGMGVKDEKSLEVPRRQIPVRKRFHPELRWSTEWFQFARREFQFSAKYDPDTVAGEHAKGNGGWLVIKDPDQSTTHEAVLHCNIAADGAGVCISDKLIPGEYEVEWRVRTLKNGYVGDSSIRTIVFKGSTDNSDGDQFVFEWSAVSQLETPYHSGYTSVRVGVIRVLDKPRTVRLSFGTVSPEQHGPMTSGLFAVDSIRIRSSGSSARMPSTIVNSQDHGVGKRVVIVDGPQTWHMATVVEPAHAGTVVVLPQLEKKDNKTDQNKSGTPQTEKEKTRKLQNLHETLGQANDEAAMEKEAQDRRAQWEAYVTEHKRSIPVDNVLHFADDINRVCQGDLLATIEMGKPLRSKVVEKRGVLLKLMITDTIYNVANATVYGHLTSGQVLLRPFQNVVVLESAGSSASPGAALNESLGRPAIPLLYYDLEQKVYKAHSAIGVVNSNPPLIVADDGTTEHFLPASSFSLLNRFATAAVVPVNGKVLVPMDGNTWVEAMVLSKVGELLSLFTATGMDMLVAADQVAQLLPSLHSGVEGEDQSGLVLLQARLDVLAKAHEKMGGVPVKIRNVPFEPSVQMAATEEIFTSADLDGDGSISFEEFRVLTEIQFGIKGLSDPQLRALFNTLDVDKNGVINKEELRNYLTTDQHTPGFTLPQ